MRLLALTLLMTPLASSPSMAGGGPLTKPAREMILPGETFMVEGRPAFVFLPSPEKRSKPQPWVFYGPTLPAYPDKHEKWMHEQFLAAGVAVAGIDVGEAYGSPKARELFTAFYQDMTTKRGFVARPCLLGRSRGGLWVSSWAADHPDKVAGLAGIYPAFDFRTYPGLTKAAPAYGLSPKELESRLAELNPIERVDILAKAKVPALLIHGDEDKVVPLKENSAAFAACYKAHGAEKAVTLIVAKGQGHNFWEGFFRCQELVDFVIERARAGAAVKKAQFYVAPHGDDRWSGTLAEPNADRTDGPFATLDRARDAVRDMRAKAPPKGPITVLLRGGRYEFTAPVRFGPEDSGSAEAPVIYAAFPGETPLLSGGQLLTGWAKKDKRWMLHLPEVKAGTWTFRQLFVNGERRFRSKLPQEGFFTVAGYAGVDQKKYNTPSNRFEFQAGNVRADWKNLGDVECVVLHFWVDTHLQIASVDEKARVVTFDRSSRRRFSDDYRGKGARYYVENVFEALGPGQFYLDRTAGTLYYEPFAKESPTDTPVVAPRLNQLIHFEGDLNAGRFVEHVHLRGLTLAETDWQLPPREAGDLQASSSVPGAVVLLGARHIVIAGCTLKNLGGYGIDLREGCRNNRIAANEISHCAAGGIKLNGGAAGSPEPRRTEQIQVTDNHLHHLGQIFHSGVGILSMHAAENTYAHNHIHHLYYTAISVGWVWGYGPSVSKGNKVEFNHLHDIGQGLLSDMGGVYLLGPSPGTVVRHNRIHDVDSWSYGGWGIYTDEGSTGILIENNIVYRTKSGGFHQHYGKDNVIRNNIFALARTEQIARSRAEPHTSFTFERNLVYYRTGTLLEKNWEGKGFVMDRNLYWNAAGKEVRFPGGDFAAWQKKGHDANSLIADPKFLDPERGDFRLAPDSPALGLGFEPIDLSGVGPRKTLLD